MKNNYDTIKTEFVDFLKPTSYIPVEHAITLFKTEFEQSRRTYFRWKKNIEKGLPLNYSDNTYRSVLDRRSKCYFCDVKTKLVIHHKNLDRQDNKTSNLVVLCSKCHSRIHSLLNNENNINIYVVNVNKVK